MAMLPQQSVLEINTQYLFNGTSGLDRCGFEHLPLQRFEALTSGEAYVPKTVEGLRPCNKGLPWLAHQCQTMGWVILDHKSGYEKTSWSISPSSKVWLETDQLPHDVIGWCQDGNEQRWRWLEDSKPSLIVIRWFERCFVHCDPKADLEPVPDDLGCVIQLAIEQSIKWIEVCGAGQTNAQAQSLSSSRRHSAKT